MNRILQLLELYVLPRLERMLEQAEIGSLDEEDTR